MLVEIIGILAVITGTFRLIPQIVQGYKSKKVRDVSLAWESLGVFSSFLWGVYAYLNSDWILFAGAGLLLISYIILIFQKEKYRRN